MATKRIALFDIDRTVYEGFLLFTIVGQQVEDRLIAQAVLDDIIDIKNVYEKGDMRYELMVETVLARWADGLTGKSLEEVEHHTEKYLRGKGNKFYFFVKDVIDILRDTHDIYFVTGEPQFVANKTKEIFNANGFLATEFEIKDGRFTGKVSAALSHGHHKLQVISDLLTQHGREGSYAFGDSEGDIDMLDSVEYAVCVKPTAGLKQKAIEKGWFISMDPDKEIPLFIKTR